MLYSQRYPVNITFQGAAANLSYFFSCVVCQGLAPLLLFDVHILKHTKTIICLRLSKYWRIFTEPEVNNC